MEKQALYNYENGHNCAQSILKTYASELNMEEEVLMKMSQGLGSGMFIGETCGAVTASAIVLGLKKGNGAVGDREKTKEIVQSIKSFEKSFREKYCSLNCKELKTTCKASCKNIVEDSARILKELV